ncbi:hypothetical protein H0H93_012797, partial [Arthromyces matolae]
MAHLANIHKLPTPTDAVEDLPVGALILSLQAVEHALNEYRTGSQVINKTSKGHFSSDNYGDKVVQEADQNGRPKLVNKPWASRYIATIKKFDAAQWKSILESSQEYLDAIPPRRGRKSRSSSHASSSYSMAVDDEEILFESDVGEGANEAGDKGDNTVHSSGGDSDSSERSDSESNSSQEHDVEGDFRIISGRVSKESDP